ncbi:MAG: polysaccharide biosynthesis protein [Lysobacterales bacterium]|nr:MAG: polysaccharide biosynthesis protein [Xanthomonadales bacterium]
MRSDKDSGPLALLLARIVALPRYVKRAVLLAVDATMIPLALFTAVLLKEGSLEAARAVEPWVYLAITAVSLPVFARIGLYRAVLRFLGSRAAYAVLTGVSASVLTLLVIALTGVSDHVSLPVTAIFMALALVYVGGTRMVARDVLTQRFRSAERVVIYGAGKAGTSLIASLNVGRNFVPVGFVDDNQAIVGSTIRGVRVWPVGHLPELVRDYGVTRVLLAVPSVSRRRRQEILAALEPLGVYVQSVPDIADVVVGKARLEDLRDVDSADLLGRDAVAPDERLFDACIRGKVVMVTGAGGSIGSELCRQIAALGPRRLVLFEMSELALYQIERELRSSISRERLDFELVSLLGNAHHKYRVREVIQAFGVQTVYHAAAYKHVPIVEHNVIEGIHNNVIGTWYTAEASLECGVETFVLVSTDKAVNPTNVMGATKRLAEIVLQGLQERGSRTRFCMVRFGNVLESSGSVVPVFREQLRNGGPITVTHPDVIRYFMTIPEASQLVLQAGAMAQGGDVFVLDMGKPIRIADLARRMIKLAGLTVRDAQNPDGDVEIVYTGLRPAEKLYEELLIGSNVSGTGHPMIMRAREHSLPWDEVQQLLHDLIVAMGQFDVQTARELLKRGVSEYRPSGEIVDRVWARRESERRSKGKVTSIETRRAATRREAGSSSD